MELQLLPQLLLCDSASGQSTDDPLQVQSLERDQNQAGGVVQVYGAFWVHDMVSGACSDILLESTGRSLVHPGGTDKNILHSRAVSLTSPLFIPPHLWIEFVIFLCPWTIQRVFNYQRWEINTQAGLSKRVCVLLNKIPSNLLKLLREI